MQTKQERREYNQKYKKEGYGPCIYLITNKLTGEQYIGATVNLRQRMFAHWCSLRGGRHHSERFVEAFYRDGKSAFEVSVLEYLAERLLYQREAYYIITMQPAYNDTHKKSMA